MDNKNIDDGDEFKRDEKLSSQIRNDMESVTEHKHEDEAKEFATKVTKKFLKTKLPVWLIIIGIVAFSGFRLYVYINKVDPVNLRPTIQNAEKVKVEITMCNEQVDKLNLNVREEEKRLIRNFKDVEKVKDADVVILRKNCTK